MKKGLSIALAIALVFALAMPMSVSVFADDGENVEDVAQTAADEQAETTDSDAVEETSGDNEIGEQPQELDLLTRAEGVAALVTPIREIIAEMAVFLETLIEAAGVAPEEAAEMFAAFDVDIAKYIQEEGFFTDVDVSHAYFGEIAWAKAMGLVVGSGNSAFRPDDMLTRQDLAVILVRLISSLEEIPDASAMPIEIADIDSVSDYAKDAVKIMLVYGAFTLDDDGNFNPLDGVTVADIQLLLEASETVEATITELLPLEEETQEEADEAEAA